ncbi:hypothetical protein HRD49_31255 [Corallococcus exiguus]|uniref:hypothetical protein n=1 Tax=Corallococcus TaxID=83461 RepID=UPI000F87137B|nr:MULTISPECIES: hypothetical protein [Corallococcus]NNC19041.1 hypothetical protein [Corallococcus exiguus]NRD66244.1 hypothetical protein [Corallococcus exiguus]RUO92654.1 hypothetical protein D7Y11_13835 [Corallococcus sp. AB018]
MEKPRYVEQRLARLDAAHSAALAMPDAALAAELQSERDLLQTAPGWEVSDRTVREQGRQALGRWFSLGQGARARILSDPTLRALGEEARTTEALDFLLDVAPDGQPDEVWLGRFREALIAAGGVDTGAAAFNEALFAGYRDWFLAGPHPHPYPFDDLVVVLPVRLETYFPEATKLWLRVLPDEASIRRDVPTVETEEELALNTFWSEALKANGFVGWTRPPLELFDLPETRLAWERLAARVTPQRAAWLIPAFPPTPESLAAGRPVAAVPKERRVSTNPVANRVAGFPESIEVWAVWGDDPALRLLQPSKPATRIDPELLVLDTERIKASHRHFMREALPATKRAWWMDWDAAKDVGLGLTFDLPAGCTSATLRSLYVTGQSDESPAELFRAHADAGELAVLPLGMPTNAVAGSQTELAPSNDDPGTWRRVASRRLAEMAGAKVSELTAILGGALTGNRDALPALPRDQDLLREEKPELSHILSRALWPALRGHQWRDIFGRRGESESLRRWAQSNLAPEGPWCPIRIGDQPYGLLPISDLDNWRVEADPTDDAAHVEESLVLQLRQMRDAWAQAARRTGTVRGRDAAGLLDLIGKDAMARRYVYRWFLPAEFFSIPYILEGHLEPSALKLFRTLHDTYARFDAKLATGKPQRFYLTRGGPSDLQLPLIWPTSLSGKLRLKEVTDSIAEGIIAGRALAPFGGAIPRSLLVRLLIHSAFTTNGALGQEQEERRPGGQQLSLLNPLVWPQNKATAVEEARRLFESREQTTQSDVLTHIARVASMLDDLHELRRLPDSATADQRAELPRKEAGLERALRATLDTAAHRIDPWITGIAARRAKATENSTSAHYRLGIYGWLDGPFVGSPGPTDGGLLHTPSHAQTLTAVILRDKYLTSRLEGDADAANPWAMTLDSQSVQLAEELAEEVRIGVHPYEALGRRVEQAVGTWERVDDLRQKFPLRPDAVPQDPNTVCDGLAALHSATLQQGAGSLYEQLDDDGRTRIDLLRRAADAYGDLLVAEAVHSVVSGRPDAANAAMEAASGLGKPAGLEFVQTPESGIALKASVLSVLPAVDDGPATGPAAFADASSAAWMNGALATGWSWQVAWGKAGAPADGVPPDATDTVSLADMALTPADAALLPEDILNGIAVALSRVRLPALIPGLDATGASAARAKATAPTRHRQARGLVSLLGGPPATAEDFAPSGPSKEPAQVDWMAGVNSTIAEDLRTRYQGLQARANELLARLDVPGLDVLRESLLWGLLPESSPDTTATALALLYGDGGGDGALMASLVKVAREALDRRLKAAPSAEPSATQAGTDLAERNLHRPQEIARAIAELGSADGHMIVLAHIQRESFAAHCALAPDAELETDWLTTVAAVRRDLARVEAWNLETGIDPTLPVLAPFSNTPGDPWQLKAARKAIKARSEGVTPGGQQTQPWAPHLVAAFGAPSWTAATTIAVGLVDGWTETVPTLRRSTRAAFGFNAPAAHAPQAILLAVPPVARTWLSPETLAAIVADARTLSHARAARLEDLTADYQQQLKSNPGEPPVPYQDLRATMMMPTQLDTGIVLTD